MEINSNIQPQVPKQLENALVALSDYHQDLIQKYTLNTQVPNVLEEVANILRQKSNIIKTFIITNQFPVDISSDTELKDCLDRLKSSNIPYSAYVNTMISYWTKMMFEDYPFCNSPEHIRRFLLNSIPPADADEEE